MKYLTLIIFTIFYSCEPTIPYKGNKDLLGSWKGRTVLITANFEKVSFPMDKYGFASFTLYNDSTYDYLLEITRDVILEKEVFGNPYAKTILRSGFKDYKRGYYLASDSMLIFKDANKIISREYSYYFDMQILYVKFNDKENKQWIISWEK